MEAKQRKHNGGVSLPEVIIFDVLSWLPAKALSQFRCVCKGWRALIAEPAFVATQRSRAATDPHLIGVFIGHLSLPEVWVMDMEGNVVKVFEIMRSTPQLPTRPDLICTNGAGSLRYRGLIIDPAAGQAFAAIGATDPAHRDVSYRYSTSFGRATPSGVFKVLRLQISFLADDGCGNQLCEVATITDGSSCGTAEPLMWRRKSAPPSVINCWRFEHKAVVNGVVYFIHELDIDGDVDEDDDVAPNLKCVIAFDLESEEWKAEAINGPALGHPKEGQLWNIGLVELNGTLAFVHEVIVNRYPYTSIWLLVDPDKSVWVEYMIPMPKNQIGPAKPLGALVDGRILLLSSVWHEQEMTQQDDYASVRPRRDIVLFYNPGTKAFTDFVDLTEKFRNTLVFYTGSLLS